AERARRPQSAWVLAKPFGQWIVGAIGVAIAAVGLGIGLKGCWGEFKRRLELKQRQRRLIAALARFGFVVRSAVFTTIGVFLLYAALDANFREAKGLAGALQVIQQQSYGSVLLALPLRGCSRSGFTNWQKARSDASPRRPFAKPPPRPGSGPSALPPPASGKDEARTSLMPQGAQPLIESRPMTERDLAALRRADAALEHPGLPAHPPHMAGKPIELIGSALPASAAQAISAATSKALEVALQVALRTIQGTRLSLSQRFHKVFATASGA